MPQGNRDAKPRAWTTNAILALVEPLIRRLIRRALNGAGIGGDAIDHGVLDGLSDDDHAQYLLDVAGAGGAGIDVIARVISINVAELLTLFDHGDLSGLADDDHLQYLLNDAATGGDGIDVVARIISVAIAAASGLNIIAGRLNFQPSLLTIENTVDPAADQLVFMDSTTGLVARRTTLQNLYDTAAKASVVTRDLAYLAWRDFL